MFVYVIAVLVILVDQGLKYVVRHTMHVGQTIPLIDHVVALTYIHNPGAAFGMLQHQTWLFIVIALAVIAAGIMFERRTADSDRQLIRWAIALLVGGAIGNLIDRILYKTVVDYMNVQVFIFNFADAAITFAVVFFLWDALLRDPKRQVSQETSAKDE